MKLKITIITIVTAITCFIACRNATTNNDNTYFGGVILNPNTNFVILKDLDNITLDTLTLDNKNTFIHKFEAFKPGIYNFYDGLESQSVLIEKGDSITFLLNTINFDESLTFSGNGSKKNNYLMDLFLENETQEQFILKISQLEPQLFSTKLDSLKILKEEKLKAYKKKHKLSTLFTEVAEGNILYHHYYCKEFYPFARFDKDEFNVFADLDPSFYSYRKNVDYNNTLLQNYRPYRSFLRFHFNNIALSSHFKHSKDSLYNSHSLHYNLDKLNLIDKKIKSEKIKNDLSFYYMMRFLNDSKDVKAFETALNTFKNINTNSNKVEKVSNIVNSYTRLKPGYLLPNIDLIDKMDNIITLKSVISKPTIIYFWSNKYNYHLIDAHKKALELKVKYPEVEFIAINADNISSREQAKILRKNRFNYINEFHFKNPETAKDILAIRPINNVFIVNKDAKIINPKANMFAIDFEQQLVELLN
ncbi:TlpA family protein disulfide reductase [Aurantibacter sp.]|uniref:TlpA family protein disulfide reductase n=1 Tax=Aurantibacter sp. TaxID=2807103 RepID=UPI0035C8596A